MVMKRIREQQEGSRVVIIDVETTGFSTGNGGRVIEVGLVEMEEGRITAEFAALVDCGAPISIWAFRIHGINRAMLVGQPRPVEVWPQVLEFIGSSPLVAHNAAFDCGCLRRELSLLGFGLTNPWHCTVSLARRLLPDLPNYRLETVYRHLCGSMPTKMRRHRALDDARLAAGIWVALKGVQEKAENLERKRREMTGWIRKTGE